LYDDDKEDRHDQTKDELLAWQMHLTNEKTTRRECTDAAYYAPGIIVGGGGNINNEFARAAAIHVSRH
jgi:hypothetical protein